MSHLFFSFFLFSLSFSISLLPFPLLLLFFFILPVFITIIMTITAENLIGKSHMTGNCKLRLWSIFKWRKILLAGRWPFHIQFDIDVYIQINVTCSLRYLVLSIYWVWTFFLFFLFFSFLLAFYFLPQVPGSLFYTSVYYLFKWYDVWPTVAGQCI